VSTSSEKGGHLIKPQISRQLSTKKETKEAKVEEVNIANDIMQITE
jgi:hypothetical protein